MHAITKIFILVYVAFLLRISTATEIIWRPGLASKADLEMSTQNEIKNLSELSCSLITSKYSIDKFYISSILKFLLLPFRHQEMNMFCYEEEKKLCIQSDLKILSSEDTAFLQRRVRRGNFPS